MKTTEKIAFDQLANGYRVSTVYLGGNLYETMVFPADSWIEVQCTRVHTIASAWSCHKQLVKRWGGVR